MQMVYPDLVRLDIPAPAMRVLPVMRERDVATGSVVSTTAGTDKPALVVAALRKTLPSPRRPRFVLDVSCLTLYPGEILGVIGPNGSGKTTLLNLLAGAWRPEQGEILWNGRPPSDSAIRRELAIVPSKRFGLPAGERVVHWLWFHARLLGMPNLEARTQAAKVLAEVELAPYAERAIGELSEGQARRLALAQALLGNGRFLLLDEPAEGLDPTWREWTYENIKLWSRKGATIVVASHDLLQLDSVITQAVVLVEGRLARSWRYSPRTGALLETYRSVVGTTTKARTTE